ncbi:ligand-dependent nuclear receptor-interacting factor 1 [Pelobates fuscus]|uniref:ligand-dependent nuclear receptor-interacting factor 1 n=1 Tax=Pelobates fuscus TaxID=191477 RepID=UPI002FE4310A
MSNFQHLVLNPAQTVSSNQCLTGCVYQVVQTTGSERKNVLKLIPVSNSSGNFFPLVQPAVIQNGSPVKGNLPAGFTVATPVQNITLPSPVRLPVVQQPGFGNYIITTTGNLQVPLETVQVDNKATNLQNTTIILEKSHVSTVPGPQLGNQTFVMMNPKSPPSAMQYSPKLPSGHHLQIPANAEVKSVPASLLPSAIQQKILAAASCNDASKNPSVIYVSPVNTVRTLVTKPLSPIYPKQGQSGISPVAIASTNMQNVGGNQQSGGTGSPKAPMKWIVQENNNSASCLVPVKSSNDTASKILKILSGKHSEETSIANILPTHNNPVASNSNVIHIKDNALVMYNNKIYLLAKRGSDVFNAQLPQANSPDKSSDSMKDISNKVVEVVLSKNKVSKQDSSSTVSPCSDTSMPLDVKTQMTDLQHTIKQELKPRTLLGVSRLEDTLLAQTSFTISKDSKACPPKVEDTVNVKTTSKIASQPAVNIQSQKMQTNVFPPVTNNHSLQLNRVTDQSLRLKFGLIKKEKVFLKRLPLLRPKKSSQGSVLSKQSWKNNYTKSNNFMTDNNGTTSTNSEDQAEMLHNKRKSSPDTPINAKRIALDSLDLVEDSDAGSDLFFLGKTQVLQENSTAEESTSSMSPFYPLEPMLPFSPLSSSISGMTSSTPTINRQAYSTPSKAASSTSGRLCISAADLDDTIRDEKIWRLKELLKEREEALEAIRRQRNT